MNKNRSKYLWYTPLGRLCVRGQCANGALHGRACAGNRLVRSWKEYCSSLKDIRSFASVARTFVYAPGIGKHNWLSSAVPNVENCKGSTCPCARNQCCMVCSAAVLVATSTRLANSHRTIVLYKGLSSALRKTSAPPAWSARGILPCCSLRWRRPMPLDSSMVDTRGFQTLGGALHAHEVLPCCCSLRGDRNE